MKKVKEEPSEESVKTEPETEDTPKKEKKVRKFFHGILITPFVSG